MQKKVTLSESPDYKTPSSATLVDAKVADEQTKLQNWCGEYDDSS